jgi:CRISPR-associated protein (TIGR03984 family)
MDNETYLKQSDCNTTIVTHKLGQTKDLYEWIKSTMQNQNCFVFALLYDQVCFGTYKKNGKISLHFGDLENLDRVLELRIFNSSEELYIWREDDSLYCRHRSDDLESNETPKEEYVESDLVLRGTDFPKKTTKDDKTKDGWTTLTEDQGFTYNLPFVVEKISPKDPLKIRVRSYIKYLNDMQASFYDSRFVGFVIAGTLKEGEENGKTNTSNN